MLSHINIKDFAIVENLQLDLHKGMSALTGETGAGKSIIIDALDLALGGRASNNVIRHGKARADITVIFDITNIPAAHKWLAAQELEDGDEVILRRTLHKEGRSRNYINGQACPQAQLRQLGDLILNIHGQHEHQNLLKREHQRLIVDRYAGHLPLVAKVKQCYQLWQQTQQQLLQLQSTPSEQYAQMALLEYQVNELASLSISAAEVLQLETEHKQLAHGEQLKTSVQSALNALNDDSQSNVLTLLTQAKQHVQSISNIAPELQTSIEMLSTAEIQSQEAANDLSLYLAKLSIDPERLFQVEQRLTQIHDLARKHHVEPEQLPEVEQRLNLELQKIQHADELIEELNQRLIDLSATYHVVAEKLTAARKKAIKKLNKLVTESMQILGMQSGQFAVALVPQTELTAFGAENIEFTVTANPGQPLQALSKVASGGEMSRISLALQMITAQKDDTPCLIFDEVDVGIGGGTAEVVGKLLRQLGEKAQVLCITHLPQVAAQAHQHLQVQKHSDKKSTHTTIIQLTEQPRVAEIARMLGGVSITEQTLKHAAEMLQR